MAQMGDDVMMISPGGRSRAWRAGERAAGSPTASPALLAHTACGAARLRWMRRRIAESVAPR